MESEQRTRWQYDCGAVERSGRVTDGSDAGPFETG